MELTILASLQGDFHILPSTSPALPSDGQSWKHRSSSSSRRIEGWSIERPGGCQTDTDRLRSAHKEMEVPVLLGVLPRNPGYLQNNFSSFLLIQHHLEHVILPPY